MPTPIDENRYEYVGFWTRVAASLVDTVLATLLLVPISAVVLDRPAGIDLYPAFTAPGFVLNYVLPAVAIVWFWIARQATPGKMLFRAKILDAKTGLAPTNGQLIGRYFAYYLSLFGLGLGFFWIAVDRRKQGWHDKLAGTVVVRERSP